MMRVINDSEIAYLSGGDDQTTEVIEYKQDDTSYLNYIVGDSPFDSGNGGANNFGTS